MKPFLCTLLLLATAVRGTEVDLTALSIEELMNIEVTSPGKKEQSMFAAAAAISVLTGEDLRRSGATSIPEALRLLPGVQAGRVNASKWAISVRGFNDLFANKLLVLVDGRSVYTPVFSGVFWESQDIALEEVERIEVIRGPGSTLWGANAVNGVINVLTRDAAETQGGQVLVGAGTHEQGVGSVRYGGKLGDGGYYRLYARHSRWRETEDAEGEGLGDDWRTGRAGGRFDWKLSGSDRLTLQGEAYDGRVGEPLQIVTRLEAPYAERFVDRVDLSGGNLLGRWRHRLAGVGEAELQIYYGRTERHGRVTDGQVQTFDAEFEHRLASGRRQEIVWGAGGRFIADEYHPTVTLGIDPPSRHTHLLSLFVQDDIAASDGRLHLILGTKLEHNSYTGIEVQPNIRFTWMPTDRQALWGAVTRAVRTPSRSERDQDVTVQAIPPGTLAENSPLTLVRIVGSEEFTSERLLAFDLGYRAQLGERFSVDLAGYFNLYDDLRTNETQAPIAVDDYLVVPLVIDNKLRGITYGGELAVGWQALERLRLNAAYTWLQMDMELKEGSNDPLATTWDEENPNHQLTLRAAWDASRRLSVDAAARYVDELPILRTDSYLTADLRLGWRPVEGVELFAVGRHLLDSPHIEFPRQMVVTLPGTVERSFHGGMTWAF